MDCPWIGYKYLRFPKHVSFMFELLTEVENDKLNRYVSFSFSGLFGLAESVSYCRGMRGPQFDFSLLGMCRSREFLFSLFLYLICVYSSIFTFDGFLSLPNPCVLSFVHFIFVL